MIVVDLIDFAGGGILEGLRENNRGGGNHQRRQRGDPNFQL